MSVGNWLTIVCLNWSLYIGIRKVLSDQFNFELKLQIANHNIRRLLFLPYTGFRASCPLFSVGDKRGHEALKRACGRNKRLLILWFLIFNKKRYLNCRNSKVKLNYKLIVTISMWAINLSHYFSINFYVAMDWWPVNYLNLKITPLCLALGHRKINIYCALMIFMLRNRSSVIHFLRVSLTPKWQVYVLPTLHVGGGVAADWHKKEV